MREDGAVSGWGLCMVGRTTQIRLRSSPEFRPLFRSFVACPRIPSMDGDEPIPIPITDVFDLHSVPPRDVQPVVEEYLELARARGFRFVRIIHGRGIGVQRETVRAILAHTDFVTGFKDAPPEAGGWGATIVTLRQGMARHVGLVWKPNDFP